MVLESDTGLVNFGADTLLSLLKVETAEGKAVMKSLSFLITTQMQWGVFTSDLN